MLQAMTMANMAASQNDDEWCSRDKQKWHKQTVLTHGLEDVSGIEIGGNIKSWLQKESITSVADLMLMMEDDPVATGWDLTLHEWHAFESCTCQCMANHPECGQ